MQYHIVHLRDITRANGEDDITMMGTHHHHLRSGMHVFHPTDPILGRRVAELKSLFHNGVRADRRIILLLFTCGENSSDNHIIRLSQRLRECFREKPGAGEQMRLENHTNRRLRIFTAGSIQQSRNLSRMMRVIVNDGHLADGAAHLEATGCAEERRGRTGGLLNVNSQQ